MTDVLAIVSRAVFEKDARRGNKLLGLGDVWSLDRYNSSHKTFDRLKRSGGRIFLVTVRPDEQLLVLGVIDAPSFSGTSWVSTRKNAFPITDVTSLRKTIAFESGKGMSQDKGTLGMSLQTPRILTPNDVAQLLATASGKTPPPVSPVAERTCTRQNGRASSDGKYEIVQTARRGRHGRRVRSGAHRNGSPRRR